MTTIDIRQESLGKVEKIKFADDSGLKGSNWAMNISLVETGCSSSRDYVRLSAECDNNSLGIRKQDVENLIKALQKAVELGWTK